MDSGTDNCYTAQLEGQLDSDFSKVENFNNGKQK